jgi:general nucleoside transport system permease protein
MSFLLATLAGILRDSSPIVFASLGETLNERGGVVNLSVEGTMLLSAMTGFAAAFVAAGMGLPNGPALTVGFLAAMLVGSLVALIVAFGSITLKRDQVAIGFILTLMMADLSSFLGVPFVRTPGPSVRALHIPVLADIPFLGPVLFRQDIVTYLSFVSIGLMWLWFYKTQPGLTLRGMGERPEAAFARGANVKLLRYLYTMAGGALIGFGGAAFSLHVKLGWSHRHTAGFGWIALAIVIFGGWDPLKVALGAYLFGALRAAATSLQPMFPFVPVQVFPLLPFPLMILTLVLFNSEGLDRALSLLPLRLRRWLRGALRSNPPAALGTHFEPD